MVGRKSLIMSGLQVFYDDVPDMDSPICRNCIKDEFLEARAVSGGVERLCSFCDVIDISIPLEELSSWVATVLCEFYEEGAKYSFRDSNGVVVGERQHGAELSYLVRKILQSDQYSMPVSSSVCDDLLDRETYSNGVTKLIFSEGTRYVPREIQCHEIESQWNEFKTVLMHRKRFFNDSGKDFLKWLFDGTADLKGLGWGDTSVVRMLPRGTTFYRARLYESTSALDAILNDSLGQLGAPPPDKAISGRMNPVGVPVFYGAFERKTCIAELRPPVGGDVVSGEFKLGRNVRILDFACMQSAYDDKKFSYFDPEYVIKSKRRQFITTLHQKISAPILPKQEHEYLATQVIAEYLSSVHEPKIDGVIFSSAQVSQGLNIVLFSHVVFDEESADEKKSSEWTDIPPVGELPSISFVRRSLLVHKIKGVEFDVDDSVPSKNTCSEPTSASQVWTDE